MSVVTRPAAAYRIFKKAFNENWMVVLDTADGERMAGFLRSLTGRGKADEVITDFVFRLQGRDTEFSWSDVRSFTAGPHHVEKAAVAR